jgi:signal transduction histidine kinase
MTQSKNVTLDFRNDTGLRDVELSMEHRKNLYLICKEAVNNAMKYSGCKTLTVKLLKEKRVLIARVSDDGSGFDTLSLTEGLGESKNGLRNMKRRAESMGASLTVNSSAERGTEVKLEMSIA